jgi:hypothetical protein
MLSAADKIKMALDWVATQEPIAVPTVLTRWSVRSEPDVLKCPTMQTNGRVLQWNPSFVDKLSLSGTKAIVLHEVGHVLSQHQHRRDSATRRAGTSRPTSPSTTCSTVGMSPPTTGTLPLSMPS